jgi:hypothetical protein
MASSNYLGFALVLLLYAGSAGAQTCIKREHAEYKKQVATSVGRLGVATDYCVNQSRRKALSALGGVGSERRIEECDFEMQKAMDALIASKDLKAIAYAQGGCNGEYTIGKAGQRRARSS